MANKAAAGAGSIRQRTIKGRNGKTYQRWEGRVTVGTDTGTGKQIQKSFYGKTQKEVLEKMQCASVEIRNEEYIEPSKITLGQFIDIWLKDYMNDKKYGTVKTYKAQCYTHIKPALGAVKLCKLSAPQIQSFLNELLKSGREITYKDKKGKKHTEHIGLSVKSVINIHGVLTKCLKTAVDLGYIRTNPADKTVLPKKKQKKIEPLTDEQVRLYMAESKEDQYYHALNTIMFCGLRLAECTGLTWDCIDYDKGTIRIYRQLQKRPIKDGGFTFTSLKNDKERTIVVAPFVLKLLKDRETQQKLDRLKAGELWKGWKTEEERKTSLIFTTSLGERLHPQTIYNHHKKISEKIGAPDSRVHDLRHTYAMLSLHNGDDIKTLQEHLGHATASFTLDVYGHMTDQMQQDSANRMEQYIKRASGI